MNTHTKNAATATEPQFSAKIAGLCRTPPPQQTDRQALALHALAEQINTEHQRCLGALNNGLDHAREAGRLLCQAKAQLPHGQFQAWVAGHCSFSARTSRNYLRVFTHWEEIESKRQRVAVLTCRQATKLVASPRASSGPPLDEKLTIPMPGAGEALFGTTDWHYIVMAESIKHPGYLNYFALNCRPTGPDSGGYVVAGQKPIRADFAAFAVKALLRAENVDVSAVEWHVVTDPDAVTHAREWGEDEAERVSSEANYWWLHRENRTGCASQRRLNDGRT